MAIRLFSKQSRLRRDASRSFTVWPVDGIQRKWSFHPKTRKPSFYITPLYARILWPTKRILSNLWFRALNSAAPLPSSPQIAMLELVYWPSDSGCLSRQLRVIDMQDRDVTAQVPNNVLFPLRRLGYEFGWNVKLIKIEGGVSYQPSVQPVYFEYQTTKELQ